jgi:cellulose synthase operon protein C
MFEVKPWHGVALAVLALATPAHAADRNAAKASMDQGIVALYKGNPSEARIRLLTAIQAAPDWALPRAVQARVMLTLGDGPGAEAELREAIERGMPEEQVAHLVAHAALLQGDTARALDKAATEGLSPTATAYAARISARASLAGGDFAAAGKAFDRASALTPNSSSLWSDIGRFRQTAGNIGGAVDAARRAVALNPANSDALMLTGELFRGQFGLVAAIPWFERVLAADPNNLAALGELAATLGDAGRARDMLAVTRKMLSVDEGNPKAYFLQAVLAARAGNYDLARAMLYRTNNRLDNVPAVMLLTAVLDLKAGAAEQAITRLEDLVKAQPTNFKAKRLLGAAMWRAGDAQSAISVLRPIANRADADSYTLSVIGRAYEERGDRENAATYLDRAAAPVRGDPVPFEMAGGLVSLARENAGDDNNADIAIPRITRMIAGGQAGAALDKARALQRGNPGAPAAHVLVGDALMALGKPGEAAAAYQNAANIRFSEPVALRFIDALRKSGQDAAALRVLDMFLGQNPRSVSGLLLAADHFMASGEWERAIAILEGLRTRLGNRDATLLGNLGWAWFNKRDYIKAVQFSGAAYNMSPANPALANSYGWILFQSGKDKVLGLKLLTKATAIAPEHPGLAWQLGQALVASGKGEAARPYLAKAATTPNFADHKAAAAMLGGL